MCEIIEFRDFLESLVAVVDQAQRDPLTRSAASGYFLDPPHCRELLTRSHISSR
jgi:hypothetical protein